MRFRPLRARQVQPPQGLDQPGMSTISISVHVDSATPVDVVTWMKHLGKDVLWGTIRQKIFHGLMKRPSRTAAAAALFLILLCALGLAVTRTTGRSDAALKSHFAKHRADFERLVAMANEDAHLTRIAPDFTWLDDDVSCPRKNVGISEERWNEYRRLFRSVNVPSGITNDIRNSRVLFPIVVAGMVPAGYEKGLIYSATPLTPVLKSLDERPSDQYWDDRGHVLVYKPISDHWYIFYEQW